VVRRAQDEAQHEGADADREADRIEMPEEEERRGDAQDDAVFAIKVKLMPARRAGSALSMAPTSQRSANAFAIATPAPATAPSPVSTLTAKPTATRIAAKAET
jgi:hypothetical protein